MREWKVTNGYKVKADELSWEELKLSLIHI